MPYSETKLNSTNLNILEKIFSIRLSAGTGR